VPALHEPGSTAITLAVLGLLMTVSVLLSRVAGRLSVPVTLLFLGIGMLAGSEGLGHIAFDNYALAFRLGSITLVLILFDGGLNVSHAAVKRALGPAALLATVGVVATAAVVGLAAHLMGLSWISAFLLGAIVSSTDAAAVFAVLRGTRVELSRRVAMTLELESGLNDPVAVILTVTFTAAQAGHHAAGWQLVLEAALQLAVGLGGGVAIGSVGRWLLRRARPAAAGLLPVLTIALAFAAFGATTLLHGSGFLATYVAAVVIGHGPVPYRSGLLHTHDALAWLGQVVMFLVLGLLSVPSRLVAVGAVGLALGLVLALVARPAAVALCLVPFGFRARETAFVGWVGLRGAVPIILAIFPVLAGVPEAEALFDVVFFIVVVNTLVPGATVRWAARLLGVEVKGPPPPAAVLEIASTLPLRSEVLSFYLDRACAVAGARLEDVPFPAGAAVMLIVRAEELLAARGDTVLQPGDHVFVFCRPEDRATVDLLFGGEDG
jgi:potassium/hydrogen antiporter